MTCTVFNNTVQECGYLQEIQDRDGVIHYVQPGAPGIVLAVFNKKGTKERSSVKIQGN